MARATRHNKYKVGTTKMTCTIEIEDDLKLTREASNRGFRDKSAFVRHIIHEAVYDVLLTQDDYDKLKALRAAQESN